MSSPTSESPITKVIFLQKIFRFAGRSLKDLVIINSVCRDFEETMQAHHTFNLVLYDNIIKKRKDEVIHEIDPYTDRPKPVTFFDRSFRFLYKAPAWIVFQWTTVNEYDETQRQLLKALLLCQAEEGNKILFRKNVSGEDPSTTRELLRHILDACDKLGIAKKVLAVITDLGWNCIMHALSRQISAGALALLIDACARNGLDVKKMLMHEQHGFRKNCIMIGVGNQLPFDSFKLLLETCVQYGVDMKKMLEQKNRDDLNIIMLASCDRCPIDVFNLLIESCIQHGMDMKEMLQEKNYAGCNCIMLALTTQCPVDFFKFLLDTCVQHGVDTIKSLVYKDHNKWSCLSLALSTDLPLDSLRLLVANFPSNESFRATLSANNTEGKSAIDYAKTVESKALLDDPDCWQKCRDWGKQQQV